MSNQVTGGFTPFSCDISTKARRAFDRIFEHWVGVGYDPVAVATQPVGGIMYKFFCNARVVVPDAPNEAAMIKIYEPSEGNPVLVDIDFIRDDTYAHQQKS